MTLDPTLKIVPIRNGAPSLLDIPGQLRQLADTIEGYGQDDEPRRVMAVVCGPGDRMVIYHWGGEATKHEVAGAFFDAANMTVGRA